METNLKTKKGQINNKRQQLESWETKNETKMEVSAKDTEINCTDQKVMRGVMEKDKRKKKTAVVCEKLKSHHHQEPE